MNWLDFGVTRSKVTGLIMYAKIACECILIRTDMDYYLTQDILQSQWTE